MAVPLFAERVRETSTTTGTGTLTLAGAVSGFQSFSAGIGNSNVCYYCIQDIANNQWEVGIGTVGSGTLSRDTVLSSSNSNSLVSLSAGTHDVYCVAPATIFTNLFRNRSVRVATTTAGTLASSFENGDTIDGITIATGDRILVKDQSTASENGVYIVPASGAPTRAYDYPAGLRVTQVQVFVEHGSLNAGTLWAGVEDAVGDGDQLLGTHNCRFRCMNANQGMATATDGATVTFNIARSKLWQVTMGGNRTLALSNVKDGDVFALRLVQDGSGSRIPSWFSTIRWAGGSAPTLTTTLNKADWVMFVCTGSGTYDGFVVGKNL